MKMRILAPALLLAAALPLLPTPAAAQEEVEIITEGREGRGWIGVLFEWDEGRANEARVEEVVPRSPAAEAGVRKGDVVTRIDGRPATEAEVERLRERLDAGSRVRLDVRRDGRTEEKVLTAASRPGNVLTLRDGALEPLTREGSRTFVFRADTLGLRMDSLLAHVDSLRVRLHGERGGGVIRLRADSTVRILRDSLLKKLDGEPIIIRGEGFAELPPMMADRVPFFAGFDRAVAGAEFAEMNRDLGRYFRTEKGLLVLQVSPSTPASRGGLVAGDVVLKADGDEVETAADLRRAFSRAEDGRVKLEVLREGRRRELDVRWEGPRIERRIERFEGRAPRTERRIEVRPRSRR